VRVSKSDVVRERSQQACHDSHPRGTMRDLIGDILDRSWSAKIPAGSPRFLSSKKQKLARIIRAKSCIVDSGALVALLDPREEHHPRARGTFPN